MVGGYRRRLRNTGASLGGLLTPDKETIFTSIIIYTERSSRRREEDESERKPRKNTPQDLLGDDGETIGRGDPPLAFFLTSDEDWARSHRA